MKRAFLFLCISLVPTIGAAVKVAPQVVVVNEKDRGAELVVLNSGTQPAEVSLSVLFGFEVTDEEGSVTTVYPTEGEVMAHSAAAWVRVYPKKLRIDPGQQQVVRLSAKPKGKLAEGEYWARLVVHSQGVGAPSAAPAEDAMQVQVGVATEQRIPVFIRKGKQEASVKISQVTAKWSKDVLEIRYWVEGTSHAAFLGQAKAQLLDEQNKAVAEATKTLAVFVPGWRVIRILANPTLAKAQSLKLHLETERTHPAIPVEDLLAGKNAVHEEVVAKP